MSEPLTIRRDGPVTEIGLARPDKANALCATMVEALLSAIGEAEHNGTRVLVLRGEGRNFCGGFDFSDIATTTDGDLLHRFVRTEQMLQALYHAPYATVALCQGGAYGAGADIVAVCDKRLAAPGTKFRMPGLKFGVVLGTRRLAARIGAEHALGILEAARTFGAEEAAQLGFIQRIAPVEAWPGSVAEIVAAQKLDAGAHALLKARIQADTRDEDLAALVRSAAVPGLKERIQMFRDAREPA